MFVPATFEKMLADKKVPGEKKDEIRALMPLVSISWVYYFFCFPFDTTFNFSKTINVENSSIEIEFEKMNFFN